MSFKRKSGKTKIMYFLKKASTAFADASFVTFGTSGDAGKVIPCTSTTTTVLGVIRKAVASTDSDYALATLVPVEVPIERYTEFEGTTASAVAADVGATVDLTDASTVNRGATSHKMVLITGLVSATKVNVVIASGADVTIGV